MAVSAVASVVLFTPSSSPSRGGSWCGATPWWRRAFAPRRSETRVGSLAPPACSARRRRDLARGGSHMVAAACCPSPRNGGPSSLCLAEPPFLARRKLRS